MTSALRTAPALGLVGILACGPTPQAITNGARRESDGTEGRPDAADEENNDTEASVETDTAGVLFDPFAPVAIALAVDEYGLQSLATTPRSYVRAQMRVVTPSGEYTLARVGLALKGNPAGSFRDLAHKAAFKIKIDAFDDGQRLLGLRGFKLNNMEEDPSQLHEVVAYDLFGRLGIPAARAGYASVTLNGEDYGLHALVERIDQVWARRHFSSTAHIYEAPLPGVELNTEDVLDFDVDVGEETDRTDLLRASSIADAADDAFYDGLRENADPHALVRLWAASQIMAHWDGYAGATNNYYLHFDREGTFSMVPSGLDQTLEAAWYDVRHGSSPFSVRGALFERCLSTTQCRDAYEDALREVMEEIEALSPWTMADALATALAPMIDADLRREWTPDEVHEAQTAVGIFLRERRAMVFP